LFATQGRSPTHPDEDDLIALAECRPRWAGEAPVGGIPRPVSPIRSPARNGGALMAPPASSGPESNGRRRGHLRVLPDPAE
jgi:hypothetical protein